MKRAKSVEDYLAGLSHWQSEVERLRNILLTTDLEETTKWGGPCYTYNGQNVVGLGAFKSYFGLWFHQGVLLSDKKDVLINAQEGKTRALRQWRMTSAKEIKPTIVKSYVKEAIQLAKAGKTIKPERKKPLLVPKELKHALQQNPSTAGSFKELIPGIRREYAEYINAAKREATKQRRIEKILPMIEAGKGLNDQYRK